MEPYSYTGNNPIMFTDPTRMSKEGGEHDYKLNNNGSLELLRTTDSDFHTIYNSDLTNSITLNKSDFNSMSSTNLKANGYSSGDNLLRPNLGGSFNNIRDVYSFNDSNSAQIFYEFAAQNTSSEFGILHGGFNWQDDWSDNSFVFTSRESNTLYNLEFFTKLDSQGYVAEIYGHSHNGTLISTVPSGYGEAKGLDSYLKPNKYHRQSTNDYLNMLELKKMSGFKHTIFEVNEFKRFNKHTIFNEKEAIQYSTPLYRR